MNLFLPRADSLRFEWILPGVAAKEGIEIFHPAKIRANRRIFDGTDMMIGTLSTVPGTGILLPGDHTHGGGEVDIHVGAFELLDGWIHGEYLRSFWNTAIKQMMDSGSRFFRDRQG